MISRLQRLTFNEGHAFVKHGDIAVRDGGREIARIPARALTSDAIVHDRLAAPPPRRRAAPAPGAPEEAVDQLPERGMDPGAVLMALIGSPNLASRRPVFEQYARDLKKASEKG